MKILTDREILNEAILQSKLTIQLMGIENSIATIWEKYNELVRKSEEDKKAINLNEVMKIKGVTGAFFNYQVNLLEVNTIKGRKVYKIGIYSMVSIIKRIKKYLEK